MGATRGWPALDAAVEAGETATDRCPRQRITSSVAAAIIKATEAVVSPRHPSRQMLPSDVLKTECCVVYVMCRGVLAYTCCIQKNRDV